MGPPWDLPKHGIWRPHLVKGIIPCVPKKAVQAVQSKHEHMTLDLEDVRKLVYQPLLGSLSESFCSHLSCFLLLRGILLNVESMRAKCLPWKTLLEIDPFLEM